MTAFVLIGMATFVQAQKPDNTGLKDLWDAVDDLEEDVDELKADLEPKYEIYMKMDDLKGEATDENHKNWIEVISYSHAITVPPGGGGGGGGAKPQFDDFTVTKYIDRTTPQLSFDCCNGNHYKVVNIEICRSTGDKETYMEYEMQDVFITSISPLGEPATGEDKPKETVTLVFGKIFWRYTYIDPDTGQETEYEHSWNLGG